MDGKGYYDRECPKEECQYTFKVHIDDWEKKVSDDAVHCPMCGHVDTSDKWLTKQQLEGIDDIINSWIDDYVSNQFDHIFDDMARTTKGNKYLKITYKPGQRASFVNNPLGHLPEWEQEIRCPQCATRYSVIGPAYFCPCCGHNGIGEIVIESLDNIKKMISSLQEMEQLLAKDHGKDAANSMCRAMLEGSLGDVVSSFQKFAEIRFHALSSKQVRVNDFQIVEKGGNLFKETHGKGYDDFITGEELSFMKLMFQRRHVMEHNGGIVDDEYMKKSGDTSYSKGQRLIINKADVLELIIVVKKLSAGLKGLEGKE